MLKSDSNLCLQIARAGQALTILLIFYFSGLNSHHWKTYTNRHLRFLVKSLLFFIFLLFTLFFNNQISIFNTYLTCLVEMKRNNEKEKLINFFDEKLI